MKVLFFAPHAGIWVHAFPEALVAETLAAAGHEIVYMSCGRGLQEHCVTMSAAGVKFDDPGEAKARVCERCESSAKLIAGRFGLRTTTLDELLTDEDRRVAREMSEAATPATFLDIRIDGVDVGRSALGTFLLSYKKISFEFSDFEWRVFKAELRNTLLAFFAGRRALDREKPDRLIVYSSGYSVNLAVCRLAEARGIVHYYMNASSNLTDRLQKLVVARGSSLQRRLIGYWPAYRDRPCTPAIMRYVTNHFIELLRGRSAFVYSSARTQAHGDLRERLGIPAGRKVLLATMSSYDELFAAEATGLFRSDYRTPFATQVDWVKALAAWAGKRDDVFVLIRVHPREFPNKRDSVKSEHARLLESVFTDLPSNCRVNWPSDRLSLYDVAEITDVCLNSWSTAGKEMSLLGIPTVIYSPDLVFYAQDLNYVGETEEEYFRQVERAMADGWNVENSRRMFRWQALEDYYSRFDISDGFKRDENHKPALPVRAVHRGLRMIDPLWREKQDFRQRAASLGAGPLIRRLVEGAHDSVLDLRSAADFPSASLAAETAALRAELGRLMAALYRDPASQAPPGSLQAKLQSFVHADDKQASA
jgi:hypothetical protein